MTIPMNPAPIKRLNCGNVMKVDIRGDVMRLALCWPDVEFEVVTHNGVPVTYNGEPVYVLVQD